MSNSVSNQADKEYYIVIVETKLVFSLLRGPDSLGGKCDPAIGGRPFSIVCLERGHFSEII